MIPNKQKTWQQILASSCDHITKETPPGSLAASFGQGTVRLAGAGRQVQRFGPLVLLVISFMQSDSHCGERAVTHQVFALTGQKLPEKTAQHQNPLEVALHPKAQRGGWLAQFIFASVSPHRRNAQHRFRITFKLQNLLVGFIRTNHYPSQVFKPVRLPRTENEIRLRVDHVQVSLTSH